MFKKALFTLLALVLFATPVLAEKSITFAVDSTWPPMEYVNQDKEVVGFSIDLVKAIGREAGFTPVFKTTAWDGIFAGLAAGKYDAVDSSVTINEKRQKIMDFSEPYFEVKQGVIVRKGSGIKSEADLTGKTAGAQIGTTGYFAAKRIKDVTPRSYDEVGLAVEDLNNGRIDAVICDDAVAAGYALQNPEYKDKLDLAFMLKSDKPEYLGFAFPKGDKENIELVNKGLAKVRASGEYDKIFKKWFSSM